MKIGKKLASLGLAIVFSLSTFNATVFAEGTQQAKFYDIDNPYKSVNWATTGHYKSSLHNHSTDSDGSQTLAQMVERSYERGYDILAMANHDVLMRDFTSTARTYAAFIAGENDGRGNVTSERKAELAAGIGRDGRGMIGVSNSNEHSRTEHINGFFAPVLIENANALNGQGATRLGRMKETARMVEEAGGISHINHSGRYTGGSNSNLELGEAASNNATFINEQVEIYMTYPSCVGLEIINRLDNESRSDRILWDNILKQTMPEGRSVWGFSNDDAHSVAEVGFNYNLHLMPELSEEAFRESMETGAFFAVAPVARREGVNVTDLEGNAMRSGGGNASTDYLVETNANPYPRVTGINVIGHTITINAANFDTIEWIADGEIIATGNSLNVADYQDKINSYVRAQVKSERAIVFSQPFGVKEGKAKVVVVADKDMVLKGDYFNINASMSGQVNSNAAIVTYEYNNAKFDYRGYTAADGATLLDTVNEDGKLKITLMVQDYNMESFGTVLFSAKENAELGREENTIKVSVEYVEKDADGGKVIVFADGETSFVTNGGVPGDTTGKGYVDLIDLSNIIDMFGKDSTDPNWNKVYRFYDFNGNGRIDIQDIVTVAQSIK